MENKQAITINIQNLIGTLIITDDKISDSTYKKISESLSKILKSTLEVDLSDPNQ